MISRNIVGRVIKEPLGVFCGVAPFNFPALVFGWFIPFAIGAGNTFVFKPSTQSPYFMQEMGKIFQDIKLPKGVVNIIHGNRDVPGQWYPDPRISGVCLVGSTPTAKDMAMSCGKYGKRSMLLGGAKNYLVVMEDAQEDLFINNFINSCYGSAGQRCLAGSVVAMVPEIYDRFLEKMIEASKKVVVGDAMDDGIDMGPLVSAKAKEKVEEYIVKGLATKAKLVLDGRNPQASREEQERLLRRSHHLHGSHPVQRPGPGRDLRAGRVGHAHREPRPCAGVDSQAELRQRRVHLHAEPLTTRRSSSPRRTSAWSA